MPDCANIAAIIHADMCEDDRNGYSWEPRWGGDHPDGYKTLMIEGREYGYWLGSYDCSSSVCTAWAQALRYTAYEGTLEEAYFTGNMREVFERSGLFYSADEPNRRGDVYLNDGHHTAMCQDGGEDGVYGYDCLSEFSINENGGCYGGDVGDQTGWESHITEYHDYPWNTNLHYNGMADGAEPIIVPEQDPGVPYNDLGMAYRAHVQTAGWLEPVHDGQTAGTMGFGARLEAIKITPPEGVTLNVMLHVQDLGDLWYDGVERGGSDPVMGTTGEGRRVEGICASVMKLPANLEGCALYYRAHMSDIGWSPWIREGGYAGTRGQGRQVEAVEMRFQVEQDASGPMGTGGLLYQVHVEGYGWLPVVHDGMVAGTTGQARRIEAIRFTDVPAGVEFDATVHVQDLGDVSAHVSHGSVATLGTVGEGLRIEAITLSGDDRLRYQAHVQDIGWTTECESSELCGTTGQSKRIEALRVWLA